MAKPDPEGAVPSRDTRCSCGGDTFSNETRGVRWWLIESLKQSVLLWWPLEPRLNAAGDPHLHQCLLCGFASLLDLFISLICVPRIIPRALLRAEPRCASTRAAARALTSAWGQVRSGGYKPRRQQPDRVAEPPQNPPFGLKTSTGPRGCRGLVLGAPGWVPTCDWLQAFTAVCKAEQLARYSLENEEQPRVLAAAEGVVGVRFLLSQ